MPDPSTLPERLRAAARRLLEHGEHVGLSAEETAARDTILEAADRLEPKDFVRIDRAADPVMVPGDVWTTLRPHLRRFLVPWEEWPDRDGERPAPGSFVVVGKAHAAYRVHAFDFDPPTAQYLAELEPVNAHEVPVAARVAELPGPVRELTAETVDAEVYCGATTEVEPGKTARCTLRDGHAEAPERSPHWGEVDGHGVEWHETVVRP